MLHNNVCLILCACVCVFVCTCMGACVYMCDFSLIITAMIAIRITQSYRYRQRHVPYQVH